MMYICFRQRVFRVLLFLHLLWEGLVSNYGNIFGVTAAAAAALYYYFYIFNRRIVGS